MIEETTDPLWAEFKPLWRDLHQAGDSLLVVGGYGLFLKQRWLLDHPGVLTVVSPAKWLDATPRVTNDVDLVVGLDLIGNEAAQGAMVEALQSNGFKEAREEKHRRWRWEKNTGGRVILVELHARLPDFGEKELGTDAYRVKHKPSLGEKGIHAHQNAEALGCERQPFRFNLKEVAIAVPNPVTLCVMKLSAMEDHWTRTDDQERTENGRGFSFKQAVKHANDVYRVVAMMTREESRGILEVLDFMRSSPPLLRASDIFHRRFGNAQGRGSLVLARSWQTEDATLIRDTLRRWFGVTKK